MAGNMSLGSLSVEIGANTSGLKKAEKEVKGASKSMEKSFSGLGKTIAAAITIESARRAVMVADNMRRLEGVVKRLTKTTGDFSQVWSKIADVSDANGVAISDSVALFQRFQGALKNVTQENDNVLNFLDTLQKLGRIGGSSTVELSNALVQLSQGFSGGIIQAQEWNSIVDQAPEILTLVAKNIDGVNGDLGILRQKMLDGKLTAEVFYKAISDGADDVDKEFKELPKTIDQSLIKLENSFSRFISDIDKKTGASSAIADFIDNLAVAASQASAEIDAMLDAPETESGIATRLANITEQIEKESRAIAVRNEKAKALAKSLPGFLAVSVEAETIETSRLLESLEAQKAELQRQLGEIRVGVVGSQGPEISPELLAERNGTKPVKVDVETPIDVDKEIARLDLLADVYDNKFAEIESEILRKRQEAIKLYGEGSEEFLRIDSALADKRLRMREDLEKELAEKASEARDRELDAEINSLEKIAREQEKLRQKQIDAAERAAEETARAFEQLSTNIGSQLGDAITKTQSFSDAFKNIMSNLLSQLISAGITSAFGGSVGGGNIFSSLFSTAGGNAFGGGVSPIAAHRVNERGAPEMLNQAGKQYLLPNGKGGKVTPLSDGKQGGQPNISLINMGTPMNIESSSITEDGIELMINDKLAAFDKSLTAEMSKPNSSKSRALKGTFRLEQNMRR